MGAVGEAMQEFESQERWDNLLVCLRLLDKQAQSLELVQRRLQVGGLSLPLISSVVVLTHGILMHSAQAVCARLCSAQPVNPSAAVWFATCCCGSCSCRVPSCMLLVLQRELKAPDALQAEPDNAQLLCALGDVLREEQHYHRAWEVSRGRCTRAQRSLAKNAMQRGDFAQVPEPKQDALRTCTLFGHMVAPGPSAPRPGAPCSEAPLHRCQS